MVTRRHQVLSNGRVLECSSCLAKLSEDESLVLYVLKEEAEVEISMRDHMSCLKYLKESLSGIRGHPEVSSMAAEVLGKNFWFNFLSSSVTVKKAMAAIQKRCGVSGLPF